MLGVTGERERERGCSSSNIINNDQPNYVANFKLSATSKA